MLNNEFTLADSLVIEQPVTSLTWSLNYGDLVIGTELGRILKVNPQRLNENVTLVSDHLHSQIVGIDVLTPGYKHSIVSKYKTYMYMCTNDIVGYNNLLQ